MYLASKNKKQVTSTFLNAGFLGLSLLELVDPSGGLGAPCGPTPVLLDLISPLVVVDLDSLNQLVQLTVVLLVHVNDGHARGGLAVSNASQPGLVLDDAVWDTHLAAQGGKEQHHLNWLDITGDGDEFGPLLLDEGCDGVNSVPHDIGPLGLLSLAALSLSLSLSAQTLGLLLLGLGPVLVEKLEQVGGCLLVEGLSELVDWGWDLQPGLEDSLLPLKTDVLGPFNEVCKIPLWLDILSDAKRPWPLFEKWVGHTLDLWLLHSQRSGGYLLSLLVLLVNHFDGDLGDSLGFARTCRHFTSVLGKSQ